MSIRVIHIPVDSSTTVRLVETTQDEIADRLHDLVEGSFECVELNDDVHVWLNEEGKLRGMPWNPRAQRLWDQRYGSFTDVLVGPAVLTGGVDRHGDTLGLSPEQIATVEREIGPLSQK
ncbi:DUF3846 domain-containing protein [Leifsonia sp. NPDC058194]|uniref:DUF3846 domain-containing protein n=1 Tax=Leifsonia sp. NPDC058194 TaxID=3346374 RepID=UPI0036DC0B3E